MCSCFWQRRQGHGVDTLIRGIEGAETRQGAVALPAWDTLRVMGRILIVEDEADLNDLIARQPRQEGHDVLQAYDGLKDVVSLLAELAGDQVVEIGFVFDDE